tara:strand:- start:379 stop:540 length:162 start_codon:yes stop_codon:yes gene_type:complete
MFMHSIEAFVRVLCIIIIVSVEKSEERIHVCFIFLSFSPLSQFFFFRVLEYAL